jgi:hypothetical protein
MEAYDELREREAKAWKTELRHAKERRDRKSEKRIRGHLRRLGHYGGLKEAIASRARRNPAKRKLPDDTNQTAFRVMHEVIKRSES